MRYLVLALVGSLWLTAATAAGGAAADVSGTPVTLSCNDGHSVIFEVDQITLTSLLADVQAIDAGVTGTSCTLDTAASDPSSETTEWTVYDYNPSNQEIAPRNSPKSLPATTSDGGMTWKFPFRPNIYTALFTTTDPSLTGDQSMTTLTDEITLSGPATTFMTQHGGGNCVGNTPAAVRFFFRSPSASGSSLPAPGTPVRGGLPPAGFYTQFWWSNPVSMQLAFGTQSGTITAHMCNPAEWSDWDGKPALLVPEAFLEATQNVQAIGLSFGGLCFFETGVTAEYSAAPPPYETFSSVFSESSCPP